MASGRKKVVKKKAAAKRRPAAKKRLVTKGGDLRWGKGVIHPVTKTPCGGRPMSQRDKKLFTRMGKRRAGVTPTMVSVAYGLKKPARKATKKVVKKKTAAKRPARKAAPKKRTTTKSSAKKKTPRGFKEKKVSPGRAKFRYVIFDASGKDRYGTQRLSDARRKLKELKKEHPMAKLQIWQMRG
jgi:hypothetical protein